MKLNFLSFILLSTSLFSQSSFYYERNWGTYFGGTSTGVQKIYEKNTSDIYVDGISSYPYNNTTIVPTTYYNQFVFASNNYFTPGNTDSKNNFRGIFSTSGGILLAEYNLYKNAYSDKIIPAHRDESGNRYDLESDLINYPTLSNMSWQTSNVTNDDSILSKYDSNGNLVWQTYVPENLDSDFFIKTDNTDNIYIAGTTKWQNLGDPGTYDPSFTYVSSPQGGPLSNSYVVKLNSQGQKIWATYIPSKTISDIDLFDNNLYIATGEDINTSVSTLATSGTFQQAKAVNSIIKLNGNTGNRIWGTYYGVPNNITHGTIKNIRVTETGVYILGTTTTPGTYYGEEGAHLASSLDGWDLFITKFNDSGNRTWTTYLNTAGIELILNSNHNLDVKDDKIIVSGSTTGNQNIATPGAFQDVKPSANGVFDIFFSMFNTSGVHLFTSYYGGPVTPPSGSSGANLLSVINCKFSANSNAFFLYGSASSLSGYTTSNGHQQTLTFPPGMNEGGAGYIAKFSPTNLSVSEADLGENLKLYDNPNKGSFVLTGNILTKEPHFVCINDMTGRLIYSKRIENNKSVNFDLEDILSNGNYILSLKNSNQQFIKSFKLIIKK
ncbi:T9SS type A sorting domain-containing protein [Chryseobacterium sp. RG1]|uniref:T9SS type A sorting domain-containing protein n=1 Tax=Chryseobacterium tagetis TaxID=2801334 RepID=A0ABS7ZZG4_9FLAO|nr:T9SS type A sorting domain-containing protein [Chryseobacterium tagetis]MCA6067108.1 T9SS type A sorting domain-containing protein [Chryseobacterium tagetis]